MLKRTILATALTAAAVAPAAAVAAPQFAPTQLAPAPAPAPPPQPKPNFPAPAPNKTAVQVDTTKFAAQITQLMTNNGFGYQFAIAQNGKYATSGADGTARTQADNNGTELEMKATMRYELASFRKNVTALATMKLLRMHNLTIKSPINDWLPKDWKLGDGFKTKQVTFEQLLTHTSGLAQRSGTYSEAKLKNWTNDWEGTKWVVANGTVPNQDRLYKNMNYGILRVTNAMMWKAAGGRITKTVTKYVPDPEGNTNSHGALLKVPVKVTTTLPVNEETHTRYDQQFDQRHIFDPSGIKNVNCTAPDKTKAGLNYASPFAAQSAKGGLGAYSQNSCAGNAGMRLSSIEMVRYLAHLRAGRLAHPDDLKTMDAIRGGWDPQSSRNSQAYFHAGDFTGTNQVHTCGMTFGDNTQASLIVNSPLVSGNPCGNLLTAWLNARA